MNTVLGKNCLWNFSWSKTLHKKTGAIFLTRIRVDGALLCAIDMCSTSTLFILLSDLFDTISLSDCEEVFSFVEQRVSLWKMVSHMHSVSHDEDVHTYVHSFIHLKSTVLF